MSNYLVKNLHGGNDGSRSWIDYWETMTGYSAEKCHNVECSADATDGAHVILANGTDKTRYIVPLCHECNVGIDDEFEVEGPLVPVDRSKPILW
jgi:hypothetical protein